MRIISGAKKNNTGQSDFVENPKSFLFFLMEMNHNEKVASYLSHSFQMAGSHLLKEDSVTHANGCFLLHFQASLHLVFL